ncbi:MAG: AEC family transporter [Caldicoprobacterales bacterium]|nr:AEC family transporter [Clostridiales bacterium]
MDLFFAILVDNIVPIFLIILIGYVIGKKFPLDIYTLTKINIYVFVPALILVKLTETEVTRELAGAIGFTFLVILAAGLLVTGIARLRKSSPSMANAMKNAVSFYNSGNMGLPLIMLIFDQLPQAVAIQIMVLLAQNLATNTVGLYNANRGNKGVKGSLLQVLKTPSIYAVTLGFLFKWLKVDLTKFFFWPAPVFISNGLVSIALLTLGIQLSRVKVNFKNVDVYIAGFLRLIGGPLIAGLLIFLFGYEGITAQVLLISSSVPTAVNTALLAVEFRNEPDFASQVVMTTTLLSPITMSCVAYIAQRLF